MRELPIPTRDNVLQKELPPVSWRKRGLGMTAFLRSPRFRRHFPEREMPEVAVAMPRIGADQNDRSGHARHGSIP
jgi:hypothetical protein